jgi:putative transcriptional regulator
LPYNNIRGKMNQILAVLKRKGIRQIQLAESLDMSKSSVSQWCSNLVQPPLNKLFEIANLLDCDVSELLVSTQNNNKANVIK